MNNGDGLRVVLWLSGCSHHCKGCQNPQTWNTNSGVLFDESAKEELFRELDRDYISGITLSGGDPLNESNLEGVLDLVNQIRLSFPHKTIWIYTGYKWEYIFGQRWRYHPNTQEKLSIGKLRRQQIIRQCNVLIDGRYIDSQRDITLKWRGSPNQRVIDVQKSLHGGELVLWTD